MTSATTNAMGPASMLASAARRSARCAFSSLRAAAPALSAVDLRVAQVALCPTRPPRWPSALRAPLLYREVSVLALPLFSHLLYSIYFTPRFDCAEL